jgi:RNA polymerase sigma-70 factor (ECF subfamily)
LKEHPLDSELLAKCRSGDPQAIETLVREHQARVYRLCLSILDDPEEAEDATQESFISALKSLKTYRGDSAFQTWLFSIAINSSRSQLRQRKRRTAINTGMVEMARTQSSEGSPERQMVEAERSEALWRAINSLDEKHRLPIVLRYYHELSTQEIADVLNVNVGTIHSRLSNARARLNGELKRVAHDPASGKRKKR